MDERYNTGSAATVSIGQSIIKTYHITEGDELVNPDIIEEASILKHLNDKNVKCVPRLYDVNSTNMITSYNGRSIHSILDNLPIQQRYEFFITYIDRIIEAVEQLHLNGVSHNDLSMKNILIDNNDNVIIIDFNMSNFIGANRIDTLYHYYHCPEYYTRDSDNNSVDWWILGAFILYYCLDYEYIPLREVSWDKMIDLTTVRYNSLEEFNHLNYEGKLSGGVIFTRDIPSELVTYLDRLLQLDPRDRMKNLTKNVEVKQSNVKYDYQVSTIYVNIIRPIINSFQQIIVQRYYVIGVAIDIIRRLSRSNIIDVLGYNINTVLAIVGLVMIDTYDINALIKVNNGNYRIIRDIQERILDVLDWRIYTITNVRITTNGSKITLQKLLELSVEDISKLFGMSDRQLEEYFL